jgi:uncharacterized protein (DUF983 family)
MIAERSLVWATAIAVTVGFGLSLSHATPPDPPAQLVVAVLGAVVVLPLAFVFVGWLAARRGGARGWR